MKFISIEFKNINVNIPSVVEINGQAFFVRNNRSRAPPFAIFFDKNKKEIVKMKKIKNIFFNIAGFAILRCYTFHERRGAAYER